MNTELSTDQEMFDSTEADFCPQKGEGDSLEGYGMRMDRHFRKVPSTFRDGQDRHQKSLGRLLLKEA